MLLRTLEIKWSSHLKVFFTLPGGTASEDDQNRSKSERWFRPTHRGRLIREQLTAPKQERWTTMQPTTGKSRYASFINARMRTSLVSSCFLWGCWHFSIETPMQSLIWVLCARSPWYPSMKTPHLQIGQIFLLADPFGVRQSVSFFLLQSLRALPVAWIFIKAAFQSMCMFSLSSNSPTCTFMPPSS